MSKILSGAIFLSCTMGCGIFEEKEDISECTTFVVSNCADNTDPNLVTAKITVSYEIEHINNFSGSRSDCENRPVDVNSRSFNTENKRKSCRIGPKDPFEDTVTPAIENPDNQTFECSNDFGSIVKIYSEDLNDTMKVTKEGETETFNCNISVSGYAS